MKHEYKDFKVIPELDKVKARIDAYAFEGKPKLVFYNDNQIEAKRKKVWHTQKEVDEFNFIIRDYNMLLKLRNNYPRWRERPARERNPNKT